MKSIRAYKGGRTAHLHVRLLPETKRTLERVSAEKGITISDIIELVFGSASQDRLKELADQHPEEGDK